VAGVGVASVGCSHGGFSLPSGQSWSSAHFAYSARVEDGGVCAGVVDQLEAHFAVVNDYLGLTWPGEVIDYYKYVDAADFASHSDCPPQAIACSSERNVESPLILDGHELVHVYVRHLGRPPPMFEEGLAEALTPRGRVFPAPPTETWRDVLDTPPLPGGVPAPIAYWAGAWLTSYLLRTYGPALFVALYSSLPRDADETTVATTFQQVYGAALDDVWDQGRQEAPLEQGEPIWECGAPAVSLGAAADLGDRCDGRGGYATFTLAQTSTLTWQDVTLSSGFNVAGCDRVRQLFVQELAGAGVLDIGALALPAGTYYIAPLAGTGSMGLSAAPNAVGPTCADVAPFALPPSSSNMTLAIGDGPDPWFVKLHPTGSAPVTLAREWDDPEVPDVIVATVELCADCSSPCQPFDSSAAVTVADGQLLRLSGLSAPAGASVARFSYR
jgi:hypothetical protein